MVWTNSLSEADFFKKSHPILHTWSSLVATCTLAGLCTTFEGHIALMLND